jgi:DNA replicative helicase MCM subunit Mcm2 (Cdc46/Mcm family)
VQETPDEIPQGETPTTLSVFTFDGLVDTLRPGDRVEITGVFKVPVSSSSRAPCLSEPLSGPLFSPTSSINSACVCHPRWACVEACPPAYYYLSARMPSHAPDAR